MRQAFTMIELIFVIVIIGILAAVAIPKLAATRDDAQIVRAVASGVTALKNLSSTYTATGAFDNYTLTMADRDAPCFDFGDGNGGTISVSVVATTSCGNSIVIAGVRDLGYKAGVTGSGGSEKSHKFGGSQVSY